MDLNKEIREIIHKYCGGTFENRQKAASEILQIRDNEQLPILDVVKSFKDKKAPTFDEFVTNYGLKADRDNEYFFDNEYYTFEGLYYKYAEYFNLKP